MSELYIVGGQQKSAKDIRGKPEWHHYEAGVIARVDVETGSIRCAVKYVSPPEVCPDEDPSILFKSATLADTRLYVPTQTEVMVYALPDFERVRYVSLPCFNDVHHVLPGPDETLFVANTGLDAVVEVGADDTFSRMWNVIGEDPWERFSPDVDYRKIHSTKPHRSHPNHVTCIKDELWVTRSGQQDLFRLTGEPRSARLIDRSVETTFQAVHDGHLHGDRIYFTAVRGFVIILDADSLEVIGRYDLSAIAGGGAPLGWCRGVEVVDQDRVVVGFSRLRPTRWEENIGWVKHRLGGGGFGLRPTRIAMFNLRDRTVEWELEMERVGLSAIFSVHLVQQ